MARYAILATVDRYANDDLPPLKYAVRDGEVLASLLGERGFRTLHLKGANATRERVLDILNGNVAAAGWQSLTRDDLLLFFFAGHGELVGGSYVLHCYQARRNSLIHSIPIRDVAHALKDQIPCQECVCIVDACRNLARPGARGVAALDEQSSRDIKSVASSYADAKLIEMLYGCDEGQVSMEDAGLQHGVLTYHIAQVIRQGNCATMEELFDEAADQIREWRKGRGAELQEPQLYRPGGRRRITLFDAARQPSVVAEALRPREPVEVLKDLFFDDRITKEQRQLGQMLLLKSARGELDEYDAARLACFIELVEARLSPADLASALAAIESPQQKEARRKEALRQAAAEAERRDRESVKRAAERRAMEEQRNREATVLKLRRDIEIAITAQAWAEGERGCKRLLELKPGDREGLQNLGLIRRRLATWAPQADTNRAGGSRIANKMFWSLDEAKTVLGKSEDEIRQYARDGRLREFRDGPHLMFKADQVEQLNAEISGDSVDLGVSESGGLIGLVDTTDPSGTRIILTDDVGLNSDEIRIREDTALAADLGLSGSLGSELTALAGPIREEINLEDRDYGSGLLDLTRESDDTSLGAILDGIGPAPRASSRAGINVFGDDSEVIDLTETAISHRKARARGSVHSVDIPSSPANKTLAELNPPWYLGSAWCLGIVISAAGPLLVSRLLWGLRFPFCPFLTWPTSIGGFTLNILSAVVLLWSILVLAVNAALLPNEYRKGNFGTLHWAFNALLFIVIPYWIAVGLATLA